MSIYSHAGVVREVIHDVLICRSHALHTEDYSCARRLTHDLIEAYAALGEKSPALSPTIVFNGKVRWFSGFNEHGEARYTADGAEALPDAKNATEQRGETPHQRLAREHQAEFYNGYFGSPDDLTWFVLKQYLTPDPELTYLYETLGETI